MEYPVLQSCSALDIIAAITIQNSKADKISPCFTPFKIFTGRDIPISVLIEAVESSYVDFNSLIYLLFILVSPRSFQRQPSFMLSKALVKSIKTIKTGLLNSIAFSIICSRAKICSIVPLVPVDKLLARQEMKHKDRS